MLKVDVGKEEPIEVALKRFKKICNNAKIFTCVKRASYYEKPSDKRRREEKARLKTIRKAERPKVKSKRPSRPSR